MSSNNSNAFNPGWSTSAPEGSIAPTQGAGCTGGPTNMTSNPYFLSSQSVCVIPSNATDPANVESCCMGQAFTSDPTNNGCLNYCFYDQETMPLSAGSWLYNCLQISYHDILCYNASTTPDGERIKPGQPTGAATATLHRTAGLKGLGVAALVLAGLMMH